MMTKHRLLQYGKLKREITLLEDRIYAAESGGDMVTDVVQGSMNSPPYALHTVVVTGYGSQEVLRLNARLSRCTAECAAVERFVDSIADSTLHQLLDLHFVEGRTWEATAKLMGYSDDHLKRLFSTFMKEVALGRPTPS